MNKKINKLLVVVTMGLFFFCSRTYAINEGTEGMSFNMDSTVSEKQWKQGENESYFDLMMSPDEKTDLKVIIMSSSTATQKVKVTPSNAYTSQTGLVDYTIDDKKLDKTLKYPMTTLMSDAQTVELKPGEQKELVFNLKMPKDTFEGVIVGGLVAELADDKKEEPASEQTQGVNITNKFQVIKPIVVRENEEIVKTELQLNDVKPTLVGYRTAVSANIQNITPTMFGKLDIVAKITKKGSTEVIKKSEQKNMEMAPNSNFDFPISWNDQPLSPGDYTLDLVAKSGEREWPFKKDFTISKEDSSKLNEDAVDLQESEGIPMWIWILIGCLVVMIVLLIIIFIVKHHKNKKTSTNYHKNKKTIKNNSNHNKKRVKK